MGRCDTSDGTFVPIQPLIQPLFGGLTELEFLARVAGESQTNPHEIVRAQLWRLDQNLEEIFIQWISCRFNAEASEAVSEQSDSPSYNDDHVPFPPDDLEVVFYRDAKVDDGRFANNGWMQELPDPITKITWDNAVLVSRKTANELGVQNGDVVEITLMAAP